MFLSFVIIVVLYLGLVYGLRIERFIADIICVVLFLALVSLYISLLYRREKDTLTSYRNFTAKILDSLYSQVDVYIGYFQMMEQMKEIYPGAVWTNQIDKIRVSALNLQELLERNEEMEEKLQRDFLVHNPEIEEHILHLNGVIVEQRNQLLKTLKQMVDENVQRVQKWVGTNHIMARSVVYFSFSIPIISDFTRIFNEFSKDLVMDIIRRFQEISESSHRITSEIESNMNNLMDSGNSNSLAYIISEARKLVNNFSSFVTNMDEFKKTSLDFAMRSTEKLRGIQDIADSIGSIADSIKVLSLNVSIEAANAGEAGKGFQVLSRDLREFTSRTMKFAQEVKSRVKDALSTTEQLKDNFASSQANVYDYMDTIRKSIENFESIVNVSIGRIREIIQSIRSFSEQIDESIKGVVGKLQYYDITSQEVEHLGVIFERLFMELYNNQMTGVDMNSMVTEEQSMEMKRDVLRIIDEVITTSNERKILTKYENLFGVKIQSDDVIENKSQERMGQKSDDVILF